MDYEALLRHARENALERARMMYPPGPRRLQYYELQVAKVYLEQIGPIPFAKVIEAPEDLMRNKATRFSGNGSQHG